MSNVELNGLEKDFTETLQQDMELKMKELLSLSACAKVNRIMKLDEINLNGNFSMVHNYLCCTTYLEIKESRFTISFTLVRR